MLANTKWSLIFAPLVLLASLTACDQATDSSTAAQGALDDLQKKYDELVEDKLDVPVQWATDDFENIGDWDYRASDIAFSSPENLAEQLNELGNEKWEVIWMERSADGFLVVAKKPSVSYLSKIPLSKIGSLVIGGGDNTE